MNRGDLHIAHLWWSGAEVSHHGMAFQGAQKKTANLTSRTLFFQVAQLHQNLDGLEFSPTQVNQETSHEGRASRGCAQLPSLCFLLFPGFPQFTLGNVGQKPSDRVRPYEARL